MVGGTTANDLATCELKVMKQKSNSKSNPNPKSKTFLLKGGEGWSLGGALGSISGGTHLSASRGLDIAVVVIDRMTDINFFYSAE